jgi:hypothetical protein
MHATYLTMEAAHLQRHTNEQGHQIVQIKPHPNEAAALENELWTRLDGVLTRQQQRIARSNFHFKPLPLRQGMYISHAISPAFFGYADHGAHVELWRTGTWHEWSIATAGHSHQASAPELPPLLQRYWNEKAD